ncbi:MAG: FtsW/RodA/SpoVE family cell cycle protein [Lachnospiraceae bacterium]|nr:FtsW/RodA/SpoVE family cell cycle protein [Lachnospiraceae bacterium]
MITLQQYVIELSKYVILGFGAAFAFTDLLYFFLPGKSRRDGLFSVQHLLTLGFLFLCFLDLTFVTGEAKYLYLFGFVAVFLFLMIFLNTMIYDGINRFLLNNMCMLLGIGFTVISRLSFTKAFRLYLISMVSFAVCLGIPYLLNRVRIWKKLTYVYAFTGIGMLGIVLLIGEMTNGSKLSFTIAGATFQPSEFVKILFLFFLAAALSAEHDFWTVAISALISGSYVLILVFSRDLGSGLIFYVAYVLIVVFMTGQYLYLVPGIAGLAGASYAAYRIFPHVRTRVLAFLDPWTNIDNKGYQITQSLFSISSGSWFGMGLLQGNPGDIPYVEQDMIFSAVCEEFGLIFGICLLLICICCFLEMMRCAGICKDSFYRCLIYGGGVMYLFQIFLTVGGGIKFIPLTGVTLPFISYGGSSVMTTMILFSVVQGSYLKILRHETAQADVAEEPLPDGEGVPAQEVGEAARKKTERGAKRKVVLHNLPIYLTSVSFIAIFGAMFLYLWDFVRENETVLINNSYNSRQETLLSRNYRGTILASDGSVLAESTVDEEQKEHRTYPYGKLFAHVVGFSTYGRMGIEDIANYWLINTHISLDKKVANDVAEVKNPGDTVTTSLNIPIQQAADDYLRMYNGAVIVSEVKTGRILAMLSHPDFDPETVADVWETLDASENAELLNRVTQGLYPPGSTFKIFTSLAYYRQFPDGWKKYAYNCGGSYSRGGESIHCYHGTSHGSVNFKTSFAKSCNSSFANIGMSLDWEDFGTQLSGLLFDETLPIDFLQAASRTEAGADLSDYDKMQTSIGQGTTLITPMHLHLITCAIANQGVLVRPRVLDKVESVEGRAVKTFQSQTYGRILSEEESAFLTEMMTAVVEEGTAKKLQSDLYTAAGKTGSAEYGNVKGESHAWFTGFAPAEDPQIAVTVIIEGAGSGGDYAVPLARRIFDLYLGE